MTNLHRVPLVLTKGKPTRAPLVAALLTLLAAPLTAQTVGAPTSLGRVPLANDLLGPGTVSLLSPGDPAVVYPTIQAAVDAAVEGDTILLSDGLFFGPGNRNVLVTGKNVIIRSENGPAQCVVNCLRLGRGFLFQGVAVTSDTRLQGITIVNGNAPNASPSSTGGGVLAFGARPTIENCLIFGCEGSSGGGISYGLGGSPTFGIVRDCLLANNYARSRGGGISAGTALIERCIIARNYSGQYGAGVRLNAAAEVANCLIIDNEGIGIDGAGINVDADDAIIRNCTIANNSGLRGGGVVVGPSNDATLEHCLIWGNTSMDIFAGTQIFVNQFGALTINDSTLQGGASAIVLAIGAGWGGSNLGDEDPLFVSPSVDDYRLSPESPAIDAGDPGFAPGLNEGDLENFPRVGEDTVDIGCFEFWPGLSLSLISPGRAGEVNSIFARGANSGTLVTFFSGTTPGFFDMSFPDCPALFLDIADPVLLATVSADQEGHASYEAFVAPSASGTVAYLQAIGYDPSLSGNKCTVSNLVEYAYP